MPTRPGNAGCKRRIPTMNCNLMAKQTIAIRLEPTGVQRVDDLAAAMTSAAGAEISRGDASRAALLLGIEALERKHGLDAKKKPQPAAEQSEPP